MIKLTIHDEEQGVPYVVPNKYSRDSNEGQALCADICYHAIDYKVETIVVEDMKFTIYGAIETNLRTRVLHLEPETIGFNSFTSAEYLEEMLGRFMNARTKRGEAGV